ncbi:MAG: Gfo/Idh/MocA family oxidoreductase [Acutalibacteraceae bacterium]|nr:Gfo/Idh/MocA family oxidoreductase [Acutalibacteraceae bacterium]
MEKKKVILIGAGLRGIGYTNKMLELENEFQVVAVAEPIKERREEIRIKHNIPNEMCFETWEPLLDMPKFADLAIIATMDRQHFDPSMKAIEQGYDILLEKPISPDPKECLALNEAAEKHGVKIVVCFVLRYAGFFLALKKLILEGKVGDIVNIVHVEGVGNRHQSHSFVRGNWKNSQESSFMLLQKSSHDIDILQWLIGKKCKKVQSFGSLSYFNRANKPEGSPERCIEGCPYGDECFYNSVNLYLEDKDNGWFRSAAARTPTNPSDELVEKALRESEYGKCVFNCNNDVVDHQVVNLEYEDGVTATFTMSAFNKGGRSIRIMGTKGELFGDAGDSYISFYNFETRETEKYEYADILQVQDITGGHGGGDSRMIEELYSYLNGTYNGVSITPFSESCDNHITTFAAEYSRVNGGKTVEIEDFKKLNT